MKGAKLAATEPCPLFISRAGWYKQYAFPRMSLCSHFERHMVTYHRRTALVPSVQPAPCSVPGTLLKYVRLLVGAAGEAPEGLTTKTARGDLVCGAVPAPVSSGRPGLMQSWL